MLRNDENQILRIIKYTPLVIILLVNIIVTILIYSDYKKTLKKEKAEITQTYIEENKKTIKKSVQTAINYTQREFNETEDKLKKELKKELTNAKSIISSIYENNKSSKTKEEITNLIKNALNNYRFNEGRGYFFINQMNGIRVFHPIFPEKEGENISNKKDSSGEIRFQKVKKVIEEKKKGFEFFYFYNPKKKNEQQRKLAYVEYFEPYDWMIGTGEYVEEFENSIKKRVLTHLSDIDLGENNYYLVLDYKGTFVYHPNKDNNGFNIYKKEELKRLIPFIEALKKKLKYGEGFYEYEKSLNLKTQKLEKKTYFFKTFPTWDWIILTGFYENDVQAQIVNKQKYLDKKYEDYLNTTKITSIILTLLLLIISLYISKILEKKFKRYREKLQNEISKNIVQKNKLIKAQKVAKIGDWELNLRTMNAFWSDQTLKIFGIKKRPKEVGPEYLKKLVLDEDWHYFEDSLKNTLETGEKHRCQYRIKRESGEIRWVDCRGNYNKEKQIVSGIVQDITENKKLEEEKKQKEEILYQQSKLAAMDEMIGNIAHQWRQPLSTISTASTGVKLQKELGVLTDKEFFNSMNAISKSVQYLSQTIDDFRYFFNPKNEKTYINTKELIDKTLNLITAQFTAKDIEIIKKVEKIGFHSLENELIQVLINILNNARDTLIEQNMKKRVIFIKVFKEKGSINIEILDNAGGVDENIIDRIFEPYFTTKHKAQGTGIGLYMSEEIITKHLYGDINVQNKSFTFENVKYTGANFKITLNDLVD